MILTTYNELEGFMKAFAEGHLNLVLLIGAGGLAKSSTVRQVLGKEARWIQGQASPYQIYVELYRNRNRSIVVNDVDSLHQDKAGIRLLKNLCETEVEKTVSWQTGTRSLEKEGIPREFVTTSRVIIVSNDWLSNNPNTAAVEDRGQVLFFRPTALEVHRQVAEWFEDSEIYDWIGERLSQIAEPSMRLYYRARELKSAGLDWKRVVPESVANQRSRLVLELLADDSFSTQEGRATAFVNRGAGCRATFFNYARRLRN